MMSQKRILSKSAPACQLNEAGDAQSYDTLWLQARSLSDTQLHGLEDELNFFEKTGLIGIQMSELLALLRPGTTEQAA